MSTSKTDLMYEIEFNPGFKPERSPKVNVKTMIVEGKPAYVMKNHVTGTYYDLDKLSNDIWGLMDGKRTMAEITSEILAKWKGIDEAVDEDMVKEVIWSLAEADCLKATYESIRKKKRVRIVSAFEVDVSLIENSKASLKRIHKVIRPFLKRQLLWITLGFIAINSLAFSGRFAAIFGDSKNFEIWGSTVVGFFFYFLIVLGPVLVIHELAHAITLVHYGGTPGEIGTGLFYFGLMFYVNATDSWMLPRRQRIMVMMAGNISTLLIASVIVTWGFLWPFPSSISHLMYMAAFFSFYFTLVNFAPLFETDGYYVLMDLVNIPGLREDAYNYLKACVKKALRRPVEEIQGLSGRKKKILLGYAILSGVWLIYTAYQTLIFTFYMAEDAAASFLNISSAVLFAQALSAPAVVISLASITYFAMTVAGYGVIFIVAIKKAFRRALRFESIHDRDLSVFFYLPAQAPQSVAGNLNRNIEKLAKKITPNYMVKNVGSLRSVVLRMGGTKLAMVQIKEHLRKRELDFYSMYCKFLQDNRQEIFESVGIYNPNKRGLTTLLNDMADEIAASGMPEAKSAVAQIMERENRATLYLLNSAFSTVWTIELPPYQQQELKKSLLPTLFAEDLAVTDLYDEVEDFKKNTIYGFDSLSKLSVDSREGLDKALAYPEKYQVVSLFEPIKSRLVFVGRTEQIEKDIVAFGSLFVCQTWCGYLDSLLSETNLTLAALGRVPSIEKEDIQKLGDGELFVLHKNLSTFVANEKLATASLERSEKCLLRAVQNVENLRGHFLSKEALQPSLLDSVFAINTENLKHLPKRFETFWNEFQRLSTQTKKMLKTIKTEYKKREQSIAKKKRQTLLIYPLILALSAVLAHVGFALNFNLAKVLFIVAIMVLNAAYWFFYYLRWRSFHTVRKYPSSTFSRVQVFLLAFAQATHKFLATSDVLTPTEGTSFSNT